jgi:hypothetical protein
LDEAELKELGLDAASVRIERFTDNWARLPTTKLAENGAITYVSTSPGFSVYAIAADGYIHPALIIIVIVAVALVVVAIGLTKWAAYSAKHTAE